MIQTKILKIFPMGFLLASMMLIFGCISAESGQETATPAGSAQMNSTQCAQAGGRVVNTLGGKWCGANESSIGKVTGLRCECTCCAPA